MVPLITAYEGKERFAIAQRDRWEDDYPISIQTRRWKLFERWKVVDSRLVDLFFDRAELGDLSARYPVVRAALHQTLVDAVARALPMLSDERVEIDPILLGQLRRLEYIE